MSTHSLILVKIFSVNQVKSIMLGEEGGLALSFQSAVEAVLGHENAGRLALHSTWFSLLTTVDTQTCTASFTCL